MSTLLTLYRNIFIIIISSSLLFTHIQSQSDGNIQNEPTDTPLNNSHNNDKSESDSGSTLLTLYFIIGALSAFLCSFIAGGIWIWYQMRQRHYELSRKITETTREFQALKLESTYTTSRRHKIHATFSTDSSSTKTHSNTVHRLLAGVSTNTNESRHHTSHNLTPQMIEMPDIIRVSSHSAAPIIPENENTPISRIHVASASTPRKYTARSPVASLIMSDTPIIIENDVQNDHESFNNKKNINGVLDVSGLEIKEQEQDQSTIIRAPDEDSSTDDDDGTVIRKSTGSSQDSDDDEEIDEDDDYDMTLKFENTQQKVMKPSVELSGFNEEYPAALTKRVTFSKNLGMNMPELSIAGKMAMKRASNSSRNNYNPLSPTDTWETQMQALKQQYIALQKARPASTASNKNNNNRTAPNSAKNTPMNVNGPISAPANDIQFFSSLNTPPPHSPMSPTASFPNMGAKNGAKASLTDYPLTGISPMYGPIKSLVNLPNALTMQLKISGSNENNLNNIPGSTPIPRSSGTLGVKTQSNDSMDTIKENDFSKSGHSKIKIIPTVVTTGNKTEEMSDSGSTVSTAIDSSEVNSTSNSEEGSERSEGSATVRIRSDVDEDEYEYEDEDQDEDETGQDEDEQKIELVQKSLLLVPGISNKSRSGHGAHGSKDLKDFKKDGWKAVINNSSAVLNEDGISADDEDSLSSQNRQTPSVHNWI